MPRRTRAVASPELGELPSRTGRPVRQARTRKTASPYVDSSYAIAEGTDTEDEVSSVDEGLVVKSRKRKRSSSPALSLASVTTDPLSDLSDQAENVAHEVRIPIASGNANKKESDWSAPLQIVLNVPAGGARQIIFNIPLGDLLRERALNATSTNTHAMLKAHRDLQNFPSPTLAPNSSTANQGMAGFLELPPELRNLIYGLVLVSADTINFGDPGRTVLYSENEFYFRRRSVRHGSIWANNWSELGFVPVRKFLKMIGPINTGLIRYLTCRFDDGLPCLNRHLSTAEDRRFVIDETLLSALRHLGNHGRLKTFHINLQGRKIVDVYYPNAHFLDLLMRIKADDVRFTAQHIFGPNFGYRPHSKHSCAVERMCADSMVRKKKQFSR